MAFVFYYLSVFSQQSQVDIKITGKTIYINSRKLIFEKDSILSVLGKPDRIEKKTKSHHITEKNADGENDSSHDRIVEVDDTYFIYDKLGLIFCTANGIYTTEGLTRFIIFFPNKREFDNRKIYDFEPKQKYRGTFEIDNEIVPVDKKILPPGINYKTDSFLLYKRSFGPASIATKIDKIYSFKTLPYIELYLNNGKEGKLSYAVIRRIEEK
ncbi:MAG: hypothetical protein A2275_03720 [Bacteroidetes bacterium RIFOXYA12_FULL_35_11]|nr:MAG: hypothetical protein A2X01_11485 [Bacteroidetes bacterium GWF2_35_48]OFY73401.1 MAG: hypothetical protein A2275_03720 [Bacteroidetes bacterium RIFOXYA12_FULL_35_11]OFY95411.1 MAG: hypothetical protein A2309_10175 [Bacteroidetes bacterium RIFOXYB2_FULL_35_7]OFY96335.1 MAG: hypothetical protein A2491_06325 [Bacteroidetes bacterium RIFOXYC12_FULL_35_7]HBX53659.1 hypothetical protein [Bacteroidales bacterium]